MKNILMTTIIVSIFLVGFISAGAIGIAKDAEIDKVNRDAVLEKSGAIEINPEWDVVEYSEYVLCSGYQTNIINSRDNRISSVYCNEYNKTTQECITELEYTSTEMDDKCVELITNKIDNYGSALIERSNPTDTRAGNVAITEKK